MIKLLPVRVSAEAMRLSKASFYAWIKDGRITRPVKQGPKLSAWPAHEIDSLNRARIAGADDTAIRRLVDELHAARTAA